MKVVHLVTFRSGGAARAAERISNSLVKYGIASNVIYKNDVHSRFPQILYRVIHILRRVCKKKEYCSLYSENLIGLNLLFLKEIKEADVINFHWVDDGFVGLNTFKHLKKLNKPIVWTMHDMRPFTGGCHYDRGCEKYTVKCINCPLINRTENKQAFNYQLAIKENLSDLTFAAVGCSSWITECAAKSYVFNNKKCINIGNSIDINLFKPLNRNECLKKIGIEHLANKKILLFGAVNSTADERKGFSFIQKLLEKLDSEKYACIVFGNQQESNGDIEIISLGNINDDNKLVEIYSCADVFLAPSIQENLANTVMESLACGIPIVAFNIGGMSDMIVHKQNGYLAEPFDVNDLEKGINFVTENNLKDYARKIVEENFNDNIIAEKYINLYTALLNK